MVVGDTYYEPSREILWILMWHYKNFWPEILLLYKTYILKDTIRPNGLLSLPVFLAAIPTLLVYNKLDQDQ